MRRRAIPILCLLTLAAFASLAHAQVYRCIGAHGEPVFSGEPCGTPAPAPGTQPGSTAIATSCAESPEALRTGIAQAFASHDVNQLSGLILWRGFDQASARATLRALATWLQQPLTGITVVYPTGPPGAAYAPPAMTAPMPDHPGTGASPAPAPSGYIVTAAGDARDFGVTESGGCWLLTLGY